MKFGDLLDELIKLQLLTGEYVVFGSGPMAVRGMREARDMDILATKSFWGVLAEKYPSYKKGKTIEIGNIEISPKTKNLVVSGPYKNTRNPMLFGTFSIYLAYALFINSITSVVVVIAIFVFMLTVVVKMEEKRLLKDFGNLYEEYRKKVSMFIPWFQKKMNKKTI